ncbi:MAG: DUF1311 domain-containing protein [Myxococcales bacterium]|nr:DUF1311 domain-containing protein [Myxococcales bacterium]MCB9732815.1 DUF1311 domain-containing protein [Deltaproteobacteria bacterium]
MSRIALALTLLALALTSGPALAGPPAPKKAPAAPTALPAPTDPVEACLAKAVTQVEMNDCAALDRRLAQAELDAELAKAKARADDEGRKLIADAEAAFAAFRAKVCAVEADVFRGGSLAPMMVSSCEATWNRRFAGSLKPIEGDAP